MYKVSMEEARWGELCPDTFLPALMIGVKCSRFRLSVNLSEFACFILTAGLPADILCLT